MKSNVQEIKTPSEILEIAREMSLDNAYEEMDKVYSFYLNKEEEAPEEYKKVHAMVLSAEFLAASRMGPVKK